MKLLIILITINCVISCSSVNKPATDTLLVKLYAFSTEQVYPSGKVLELRVFESGKVHYDVENNQSTLERKSSQLLAKELMSLKNMVVNLRKCKLKKKYLPLKRPFDVKLYLTLIYVDGDQHTIEIVENDSTIAIEDDWEIFYKDRKYCDELRRLLLKIKQLNEKFVAASKFI